MKRSFEGHSAHEPVGSFWGLAGKHCQTLSAMGEDGDGAYIHAVVVVVNGRSLTRVTSTSRKSPRVCAMP